jgi:phosphate transport system protein
MTERHHINVAFGTELRSLKQQILTMGRLVDAHVGEAVQALLERDRERAARVIEADRAVNQMELAIDEQCIRILALYQPAASDLRFIAAVLKIVTDLERIGDLAVNMAERAELLAEQVSPPAVGELPAAASAARKMLEDVLEAFVAGDTAKAKGVMRADPDIDVRTARVIADVQREMERDPQSIARGVATIFFAKHIERMADHATNIAEMVVYLVQGQDVRHKTST